MDQSNNIANFGRNAGNNVLASYLAGADQKRQKNNDFYNRIFQQDQLKKQDEQIEYKRQQDQYNKEKELSLGAVRALASTNDPNQRAQIWQGYRQTAVNDLGVDASLIPETYSDEGLYKLAGATGFDFNGGQKKQTTSDIANYNYHQNLIAEGKTEEANRFGQAANLVPRERQVVIDGQIYRVNSDGGVTPLISQAELDRQSSINAANKGRVAGSQETGKLNAQAELKPRVEAGVVAAKEFARADAERQIGQQGQAQKLDAVDQIYNNLINSDLDKIYGKGETLYPEFLRSQKGIDLIAQRDQMIALLQLGARGELKGQGPITDSEQDILSRAVSVLKNPEISPSLARKEITAARDVLYKNAGQTAPVDTDFSSINDDDLLNF